jgi:hypothetical protein
LNDCGYGDCSSFGGSSPDGVCMSHIAAACGDPYAACRADPACSPYALCFESCAFDDMACLEACEKKLGDGSPRQRALLGCTCGAMASCWGVDPLSACAAFPDAGAGGAP